MNESPSEKTAPLRQILGLSTTVIVVSILVWGACQALVLAIRAGTGWLFDAAGTGPTVGGSLAVVGVLLAGGIARMLLLGRPGWAVTIGSSIDLAVENYRLSGCPNAVGLPSRFEHPTLLLAIRKWLITLLTIGTGGAGGLAAPMVAIGEAVGAGWARLVGARSASALRTCQLAAIGAAVATLFGAPLMGALFAIEVVYRQQIVYAGFAYCLLAGVVAYLLGQYAFPSAPVYFLPTERTKFGLTEYALTTFVAVVVSAPVAITFSHVMARVRSWGERLELRVRVVAGSLLTGLAAVALWNTVAIHPSLVLGTGQGIIESVFLGEDPQLRSWWFLLAVVAGRMLTTAFSLVGGGSLGLLLPAALLGGLSGVAMTELLNMTGWFGYFDAQLPVVAGVAAALVAVIRVPLAAVALSIEVWSPAYGPVAALACAVTYLVSLGIPTHYGVLSTNSVPALDSPRSSAR